MAQEIAVDAAELAQEMLSEREPKREEPPREGGVRRKLTCMDRRLILEAIEAFLQRPQPQRSGPEGDGMEGNYRIMIQVADICKVLDADDVAAYYGALEETLAERREAWAGAVNAYAKALNEGAGSRGTPPSRRPPAPSLEELKGAEKDCEFRPEDYEYVRGALRVMNWRSPPRDVMVLCEKFELCRNG